MDLQERVVLMGIHSYRLPVEDLQHHWKLEHLEENHKNWKQDLQELLRPNHSCQVQTQSFHLDLNRSQKLPQLKPRRFQILQSELRLIQLEILEEFHTNLVLMILRTILLQWALLVGIHKNLVLPLMMTPG